MSDDDFNRIFGSAPPAQTTFAERVGRADPVTPHSESNGGAKLGVYKPYGFLPTGNVGETCDVQRWLDGTEIPEGIEFAYRFLMQLAYVGEEEIRLFLPDSIVVIQGKHLRDLRKKLARRQVTFVQQWSPRVWPKSPPAGEPIIEQIQVVRPEKF
jgi:hypothetical protein